MVIAMYIAIVCMYAGMHTCMCVCTWVCRGVGVGVCTYVLCILTYIHNRHTVFQ